MAKTLSLHNTSFVNPLKLIIVPKPVRKTRQVFITRSMRSVVQRVLSASVEVDGRIVSEIGPGLLVLVGILDSDTDIDSDFMQKLKLAAAVLGADLVNLPGICGVLQTMHTSCRKVLNMRLFPNEKTDKSWDQSVMQRNYEVLLVSQFTLYGMLKGNKPDFHVAMPPQSAKPFYESLVEKFRKSYKPDLIKDGIFGAKMKVNLVNDGPVTMQLESPQSSKRRHEEKEK